MPMIHGEDKAAYLDGPIDLRSKPSVASRGDARLAAEIDWAIEIGCFVFSVDHRHEGREPSVRAVRVRPRDDHHFAAASIERADDRAFIAQVARRCQVGIQGPGPSLSQWR